MTTNDLLYRPNPQGSSKIAFAACLAPDELLQLPVQFIDCGQRRPDFPQSEPRHLLIRPSSWPHLN
jgi:hypothetical protein